MLDESILRRLAENVTPSDEVRTRLKLRVRNSIDPVALRQSAEQIVPSSVLRRTLKQKVLQMIAPPLVASELYDLSALQTLSPRASSALRQSILQRLAPHIEHTLFHTGVKWAAAFALFVLMIRAMPLVFLAPTTKADIGVQLIPIGDDVEVYSGGIWRLVTKPEVIRTALMIRTGDAKATILLNDDGVVRLEPKTTFKLHDIGDRPQFASAGPTATLVRGKIWVLGLLQPLVDGISIQTLHGDIDVNSGSASINEEGARMTVAVYDRGVTLRSGKETSFIVSGERGVATGQSALAVSIMSPSVFTQAWVSGNLEQDAVHRAEIAKLQDERRQKMAGILPTSILYPAKRIAEEVDVLFTLTKDGKNEKRITQADTRLSEALALVKEGQNTEAAGPLTEYRDSLIAMASGTGDNLVKFLIKQQIADATISITPATSSGKIQLVRSAVMDVTAALPDSALKTKDIEGYVLVDKLAEINHTLSVEHNLTGALVAYAEVSPYLKSLLTSKDGPHPLLTREARALLVTTSSLIKLASKDEENPLASAAAANISQYLPAEQASVLVSEEELDRTIQNILVRIFIFKAPLSRYNQLMQEMVNLRNNSNRGTLLRRLYRALPENSLGGYVLTEIKNFGDELRAK